MTTKSYHRLDSYPSSDQAQPPGMYSGDGYHATPLRPKLQWTTSSSSGYNALPPRPLSPTMKPNTQLLDKPNVQLSDKLTPNDRLRQRKYQKLKRCLRFGKAAMQAISTLLSAVMFATMVFMCVKFYNTQDKLRGGRTAWPKHPKLWPTFMLLVGAGVTLILSITTLISYCCFLNKAKGNWKLTVLKYVIHLGAWATITVLYRYEKGLHGKNNDLWGWTCSDEVAALQAQFDGVVGFDSLCNIQVSSHASSQKRALSNQEIVEVMGNLAS